MWTREKNAKLVWHCQSQVKFFSGAKVNEHISYFHLCWKLKQMLLLPTWTKSIVSGNIDVREQV